MLRRRLVGSSASCAPFSNSAGCSSCYSAGCKFCEVGPQASYWALQGTPQASYATPATHDFTCIPSNLDCSSLQYSRPNTQFTALVPWADCSKYVPAPSSTVSSTTIQVSVTQTPKKDEPRWTGNPRDWGAFQWVVLSFPLAVLCVVACCMCNWVRKRRAQQLQRVYVSPAPMSTKDGDTTIDWDLGQAGHLSVQELGKVAKAIVEAEKADGGNKPRPRNLAFAACNGLTPTHLGILGNIVDRHSQVSISLDTDWQRADDDLLRALTSLLRKRERCVFRAFDMAEGHGGMVTLRLPPKSKPETVEAFVEAMSSSCHPEVDAISFFPAGHAAPGRVSTAVALTPLRLSCHEVVLRRCLMADLGTIAVCSFVRPWSGRIQNIRLEDCQIGDDGAIALAKILGGALKDLSLSGNVVGDRGIAEIAAILPACDALERLLLDRNCIGDSGAKALAAQLPRSNVAELTLGSRLGSNPIGEEGVEAMARALDDELPRAASNRGLRLGALNLDGCTAGDRGANAFALSLPKSAVMALSLSRTKLGDDGAQAIITALPRTLLSLDLSNNALTDRSATVVADAIYRLPQLAISLASNHLSVGLRSILNQEHGSRLRL